MLNVNEDAGDSSRLRRERTLFASMLGLLDRQHVRPVLDDALRLIVSVSTARLALLEVRDPSCDGAWAISHGADVEGLEVARGAVSRGIIARALAEGSPVHTPAAFLDPRFADNPSVQRNGVEAVLCVPISSPPVEGYLYLQGRSAPGPFSADDIELTKLFCGEVGRIARQVIRAERVSEQQDPTSSWRERLDVREIVGRSAALASVFEEVALVAPRRIAVLLTGPTGSGKTMIARAIHRNGPRRDGPFVEINCATLPDELAESELFGAVAGAHSTAHRASPGKVTGASGGTLFLDEVGSLSLRVQAKLLQFLQDHTYFPLGSNRQRQADVRLVTATNEDLEARAAAGTFRDDLLYRIGVITVPLPPLRDRRDDVGPIARAVVASLCAEEGVVPLILGWGAEAELREADWPGNVRQLANVVRAGSIRAIASGSDRLLRHHLTPREARASENAAASTLHGATRLFQARHIRNALDRLDWNVPEAARQLGVGRSTLYGLMQTLDVGKAER